MKLLRTKKAINIDLTKKGQVDAANSLQTRNDWKWHVSSSGIWFKIINIRHNHKTSTAGDLQAQYHKSPGSFILCSAAWVRMTPQSCPDIGTALKKHSVMKQLLRITSAVAKTLLEGNWKEEYCGKKSRYQYHHYQLQKQQKILTPESLAQPDIEIQKAPRLGKTMKRKGSSAEICTV